MNRRPLFAIGLSLLVMIGFTALIVSGQSRTSEDFVLGQKPEHIPSEEEQVVVEDTTESAELLNTMPSCRYGVADLVNLSPDWLRAMGTGWYLNFNTGREDYGDVQYTPIIRVQQHRDDNGNPTTPRGYRISPPLGSLVTQAAVKPGLLYLVGNEVDRIGQDGTEPDLYAKAYNEIFYAIKAVDPTAKFAISGLVQVTPNRLFYLDLVWDSYLQQFGETMPVDVWNAHVYVLPEVNRDGTSNGIASTAVGTNAFGGIKGSGGNVLHCGDTNDDTYCYAEHDDIDIFTEQIVSMRVWMKEHGQQNKPLVISEYGQLYPYEIEPDGSCFLQDEYGQCFTPNRVTNFMKASHSWLDTAASPSIGFPADDNKLVQQWLWFSTYTPFVGNSSNLLINDSPTGAPGNAAMLTEMGEAFQLAATSGELRPNLTPYLIVSNQLPTGDLMLTVSVRNKGDSHIVAPFEITFYRNQGLTQPIGTVSVDPIVLGCAQREYTYSIVWSNPPDGVSAVYVKVDAGNQIDEAREDDNVLGGRAVVGHELFFPTMRD